MAAALLKFLYLCTGAVDCCKSLMANDFTDFGRSCCSEVLRDISKLERMAKFFVYSIVASLTVWLAFAERGQHAGFSGLLAVVICQPWLGVIWVLSALGFPIPAKSLSPTLIAAMVSANVLIWFAWLARKRLTSACAQDRKAPPDAI